MVYKLKLLIVMLTLSYGQSFADYNLNVKGDREAIKDYLTFGEFSDPEVQYLSLSFNELIFAEIEVRWSWFVGQSKGKLKVYSDWF